MDDDIFDYLTIRFADVGIGMADDVGGVLIEFAGGAVVLTPAEARRMAQSLIHAAADAESVMVEQN